MKRAGSTLWPAAAFLLCAAGAQAQTLSGQGLVAALRQGGYVLVMRHAESPQTPPAKDKAQPDNTAGERELDEAGRAAATVMGNAIRTLKIPFSAVLTSPTYRTRQTLRLAQIGNPEVHAELGDRGQSMQGVTDADAAFLQRQAAQRPRTANTLVVTHQTNIARVFRQAADVTEGECLVFRPDGNGGTVLVARVKIDEWPRLAN